MPTHSFFQVQVDASDSECWVVHFHNPHTTAADYWLEVPAVVAAHPLDEAAALVTRLFFKYAPPAWREAGWVLVWNSVRAALQRLQR